MGCRGLIPTLILLLMAIFGYAHESRPLYFKITEFSNQYGFELSVPGTVNFENLPKVYINNMHLNQDVKWAINEGGFRQKWQIKGENNLLTGSTIRIEYPKFNPVISSIVAYKLDNSEEEILLIPPNKQETVIPKEVKRNEVRKLYSLLGIEHIWAGIDHLLFLICLFIITGRSKKLFITITGFTIAHSFTLILSALQIITLPIPPIEATIALSIVFLCYEIIHHHSKKDSLTYRHPILVASSFGLLHGLGFAAVLGEIGLPRNHMFEALLFFNIGVEIGQIIFILLIIVLASILHYFSNHIISKSKWKSIKGYALKIPIYSVGIIAAYWMFERIL